MSIKCPLTLSEVVNGAIGPFGRYSMGYMNPGASGNGYISTMKLSVDKVSVKELDAGTEGIVSYDRCEKNDAYIGQINMGTASSFCGVNGALWGYHLAKAESIANGTLKHLFTYPGPDYSPKEKLPKQGVVPVYPVGPLLDAAVRLFGRMDIDGAKQIDRRRFPPMPGAHVICANKASNLLGPGYVWAAIAVAIAEDREQDANLFIEDASSIASTPSGGPLPSERDLVTWLHQSLRAVTKSMVLCGQDQNVSFSKIFAGVKYISVGADEWGCALTCAPYVTLAQDAVVALKQPADLLQMTISQWEQHSGLSPLPPVPLFPSNAGGIGVTPANS